MINLIADDYEEQAHGLFARKEYVYAAKNFQMAEKASIGFRARERLTIHAMQAEFIANKNSKMEP